MCMYITVSLPVENALAVNCVNVCTFNFKSIFFREYIFGKMLIGVLEEI